MMRVMAGPAQRTPTIHHLLHKGAGKSKKLAMHDNLVLMLLVHFAGSHDTVAGGQILTIFRRVSFPSN
jgi:hypothetical protein